MALVFGVHRLPERERECPAWPTSGRVESERKAAFTRFIKSAIPDARERGLNVVRVNGVTAVLPPELEALPSEDGAGGLWCGWCDDLIKPNPYWGRYPRQRRCTPIAPSTSGTGRHADAPGPIHHRVCRHLGLRDRSHRQSPSVPLTRHGDRPGFRSGRHPCHARWHHLHTRYPGVAYSPRLAGHKGRFRPGGAEDAVSDRRHHRQ